jgi:hyperosmotically inducible periplasmic protein
MCCFLRNNNIGSIMKINLAASCFILGSLLAPVAAHAADGDSDRAHPMTFVKDSIITTKIKTNLADDKFKTLARISVDTDDHGAVYLSGRVKSAQQADRAVAIARATEGVTSVTSHLKVSKDD